MRAHGMPLRVVAVAATTALIGIGSLMPAFAADSDIAVVNTETIQVYTTPTGEVDEQRIYEQLSFTGNGTVDVVNPVSIEGLRNLDGFGGFEIDGGNQMATVEVDGEERLRTVSDFNGDLPLTVSIQYYLDDELVEPSDIVGESGKLEVKYTVKNVTGVDQEVSFDDGKGGTVTKTVAVPIPMVGSLSTVVPSNFTDVKSDQANMAGDGRGATKMSFTMTLFPPIGSDTAEFGYTANISDGVVPPATISALPVNPLESPSFAAAGESYQGGAATGIELTDGASEIDANLLKLRDGAGELLAGLIKLRDGAQELEAGLAGEASPGANLLADGAAELNSGLGLINDGSLRLADGTGEAAAGGVKLSDGAGQLADGAVRLSDGTGDALVGSLKLTDGLAQISGGLDQLADSSSGLPKALRGIQQLKDGVDLIIEKMGTVDDAETLIGGLAKLQGGLGLLGTGAGDLRGGLNVLAGNVPAVSPGLSGAKGGVDQVQAGLNDAVKAGGSLDVLLGGLAVVRGTTGCATDPTCAGTMDVIIPGVVTSKAQLTSANQGLIQVSTGLGGAILALNTQLIPGAGLLQTKLGEAEGGAGELKDGALALKAGVQQVRAGLVQLDEGIFAAVQGVLRLSSGAQAAYTGGSALSDGLGQIDAGAEQLSTGGGQLSAGAGELSAGLGQLDDGANELADGTSEAADGSGQLADGANKLADGLQDAADGSGLLAGGLEEAAGGAPALEDGAQRLSDEGTSLLIEAGKSTAQTYGELYAVIEAGAERADAEKMAFGAPEGALGLTAYTYEIRGEDGESGRNLARGLGGLAILSAGAGAFALRRRIL